MNNNNKLTIIILTYNEEIHIRRCINSIKDITDNIYIVDSFSTDNTVKIAKEMGCRVMQHKWNNLSDQLNWTLLNCNIKTEWILRLDCDEYIDRTLKRTINVRLKNIPEEVKGIYIKRKVIFFGKWIRHGGVYPTYLLRIFRTGAVKCENRFMDEHMILKTGKTTIFKGNIIDNNLNNLGWWTRKHEKYSNKEAIDILNGKYHFFKEDHCNAESQEYKKRRIKNTYYNRMPLFLRAFIYFLYRYFLKLGFLDGKEGLVFHFLQAFWYRFLVDAKIFEIYIKAGKKRKEIIKFIKREYNIFLE